MYDPDTNTWATTADNPRPAAGAGSAVLNGRPYVVGGCGHATCGRTDVQVYDPAGDTWTSAADHPEPVSWQSCGAPAGRLDHPAERRRHAVPLLLSRPEPQA